MSTFAQRLNRDEADVFGLERSANKPVRIDNYGAMTPFSIAYLAFPNSQARLPALRMLNTTFGYQGYWFTKKLYGKSPVDLRVSDLFSQ
jgi:hypothetical protein